ncbi:unnamed protein product [marine sediment metagenome]|uniref:DUF551 domain-containing protein n=1 Tax=marine sediment metagenome TaxID=412755 RepID=X0XAA2_9ZZZZ
MPDRLTREEIERMEELLKTAVTSRSRLAFTRAAYAFIPKAIEELKRREWVSVEERLPEKEERVLFVTTGGARFVGSTGDRNIPGDNWWYTASDHFEPSEITHWMSLPAPPHTRGIDDAIAE